jgi:hypothetical protein
MFAQEVGICLRHTFSLMENLQLVALWTLAFTSTTTMLHSVGLGVQDLGLSFISQRWSIQGNLLSDIIKQLNCQAIIT